MNIIRAIVEVTGLLLSLALVGVIRLVMFAWLIGLTALILALVI